MSEITIGRQGDELSVLTNRLILRDFREADLPDVYAFRSDPEVARFMEFAPETWPEARAWLEGAIFHNRKQPRVAYNLAIVARAGGRAIGWIGFGSSERYPGDDEMGFGYAVHRAFWGQGYATEAVMAVVDFGFRRLGKRRASAWCDAENRASARVLEKAGLRFERRFAKVDPTTDRPRDCLEYAIRRSPLVLLGERK